MEFLIVVAALACPVGMGLMMWFMAKGMGGSRKDDRPSSSLASLREEQQRLAAEIEWRERIETGSLDELREQRQRLEAEIQRSQGARAR